MSKKAEQPEPEYELKHRITGAIIMVLTAVIVIPLLLSEPALEANIEESQAQQGSKTFRSKIVPLNINNVNSSSEQDQDNDVTVIEDSRPALLDLTKPSSTKNGTTEEGGTQTALVMTQEVAEEKKKTVEKVEELLSDSAAEKQTVKQSEPKAEEEESEPAQSEQVAKLTEEESAEGWVVRVGTFSKQANVESVSSLLTKSGFKPKTTPVSTSLGPSTRVWLGPYAKRETADKISDRLKSLTGEKGYVTRTSS